MDPTIVIRSETAADAGALTVSLVAEFDGRVIGQGSVVFHEGFNEDGRRAP